MFATRIYHPKGHLPRSVENQGYYSLYLLIMTEVQNPMFLIAFTNRTERLMLQIHRNVFCTHYVLVVYS